MTTSSDIRKNFFFQGKVFYCGRCHSKHTFLKIFWDEKGDEEQQPPMEQNENQEQQGISKKGAQSCIRILKALPKGDRWSKTMLLQDSQLRRRVVLMQHRESEVNCRANIPEPVIRLSNSQTRWYRGNSIWRPTKQHLETKRKKLLLLFLQNPLKTKDFIQGNS